VLVAEPSAHDEQRSIVGEEGIALFENVRVYVHTVGAAGGLPSCVRHVEITSSHASQNARQQALSGRARGLVHRIPGWLV
jgi:hypothetical protein